MLDSKQIFIFTLLAWHTSAEHAGYQYQPPEQYPPIGSTNLPTSSANYGYGAEQSHSGYNSVDYIPKNEEVNTDFYAFEAPYDSQEDSSVYEQQFATALRKNLRVVFIKAPENKALEGAFVALAKQSAEDKTAIYVLNKQNDASELASKLSAFRLQHNSKPEVHFVKYRTPEEAAYAQQHIQAHYRSLPGSEQHSNSEIAPTLNYASTAVQSGGVPSAVGNAGYGGAYGGVYGGSEGQSAPAGDIDLPNYNANVDANINELPSLDPRQAAPGSKMVFPTDEPTKLHNAYLPPYRRRY